MSEVQLDQVLSRIAVASSKLNNAAEEATKTIESLEEQLVEADPGVTVWGEILVAEKTSYQRDESAVAEAAQRVVTLGFTKVKKKRWGLAVKEEYRGKRDVVLQEEVTQLRKADRNLRLLALPHLPQLADLIAEELEVHVEALEAAAAQQAGHENGAADAVQESAVEPASAQASA